MGIEMSNFFSQATLLKIKSVTDSLFKYGLLMFIVSVSGACFIEKTWVLIVMFSFTGLLIILGCFFYSFFANKNPDYLRSETYQSTKQALELLGDNERSTNPNIKGIRYIMNPNPPIEDNDTKNPMLE